MITEPPPNPPSHPAPEPRRGLHPMAWVGIGCGVLLLLAVIAGVFVVGWGLRKANEMAGEFSEFASEIEKNPAKATAELVVRLNPDLEMVESNGEAGTMTILDKKSGKQVTLSYDDISEGKISFETEDGTYRLEAPNADHGAVRITTPDGETTIGADPSALDRVPAWVKLPADAPPPTPVFQSTQDGKATGSLQVKSPKPLDDILTEYQDALEAEGFEVSVHRIESGGRAAQAVLSAEDGTGGRTIAVTATVDGSGTSMLVNYSGRP